MLAIITINKTINYNELNKEFQTSVTELKEKHQKEVLEIETKYEEEIRQYKRNYNITSRDAAMINRDAEGTYLGWFSSTGYCTEDWRGTGKYHPCNSGDPTVGAMGEKVIPYQTIAVDPNVIALGSQLKVVDEYGNTYYVKANDTGGAIKGNKIDMVCNSHADAFQWGRRKVEIWLLN